MTLSFPMVLDWEERVQLSWLPDTQGVTLRHSVATHGYISSVPGLTRGDMCT